VKNTHSGFEGSAHVKVCRSHDTLKEISSEFTCDGT